MSNKINITQQRVITNKDNTFFTNNKITVGSQIPTNGLYEKGDLIVNIGTNNLKEPMWVCVKSGEPGTWEVVGNGSNSGGSNTRMVSLTNNVTISSPTNVVNIGISFNKSTDSLLVFKNGVNVVENIDFTISDDNTQIVNLQGNWNEESLSDYTFTFIVFKNVYVTSDEELSQPDLSDYQQKTDNNLQTSSKELVGAINEINQKANKEVNLSPYQQKTDNNLQTSSKELVGAINELFQSANNGKELIASAIGEPLNAEDTFSAMSSDINGLLSQFKTNMMNAGVVVESGDKFESLIEKIKGLTEGEGNKGIQFAEGTSTMSNGVNCYYPSHFTTAPNRSEAELEINLDFNPSYIFCKLKSFTFKNLSNNLAEGASSLSTGVYVSNTISPICYTSSYATKIGLELVDNSKFKLYAEAAKGFQASITTDTYVEWYAIGVGEEDTTLRDSLADILENKGVDVTEEDDMADLITKVDSISSGGLDIISATELPATGRENQICVIQSTPVDEYIITSNNSTNTSYANIVYLNDTGTPIEVQNGNQTYIYNIDTIRYNSECLPSYYWNNNTWKELCALYINFLQNKKLVNSETHGGFYSNDGIVAQNSYGIYCPNDLTVGLFANSYFKNILDFSSYSKIKIKAYTTCSGNISIKIAYANTPISSYDTDSLKNLASILSYKSITVNGSVEKEYTIDIQSWNKYGYMIIEIYQGSGITTISEITLYK